MCGIVGLWYLESQRRVAPSLLLQMTRRLRHRGPDDEGYLLVDTLTGAYEERRGQETQLDLPLPAITDETTAPSNLAFGFRRLAILDVSSAGHQPMKNSDGSLWIVFNGEIYNYVELRAELQGRGYHFSTATDTEVILAAYAEWGESCLEHFNGMWALALWDNRRRQLFCARDRFGIKPFYYFWDGAMFAFASEIKALLPLPKLKRRPNDPLIYDYLSFGLLDHTAETFFEGIHQLPPAHYLVLKEARLETRCYWDLRQAAPIAPVSDERLYAEKFYALFEDAVRLHLRSDVAIGTCLSGGLDSSAIVCVANKLLFADGVVSPELVGQQQKTFSSCFEDPRFDERQYIQLVLNATNAEPNYTFPSGSRLLEDMSRLVWHQDEPFGSTSIYAQWCVMQLVAERGVKVLLDGQGGDELLAGYHTYFDYYWATLLKQGEWGQLWRELSAYRARYRQPLPYLAARSTRPYLPPSILRLARRLKRGGALGLNSDFARRFQQRLPQLVAPGQAPLQDSLYSTLMRFSLPALLHYEDRNSMAHSVEARVPFLDYRLAEYIFALPDRQKIQHGLTKAILRNSLKNVIPEAIRTRTDKMGFATPERVWFAHELKHWMHEIFESKSFRERGYCDAPQILAALQAQTAGRRDLTFLAWRWVNLELWFRELMDQPQNGRGSA